ncbi:hypothetical protein O0L34_g16913 [Tuta absoluta]|nr:hypothetical protein O0L34_g16913 [Tuta absoluta]
MEGDQPIEGYLQQVKTIKETLGEGKLLIAGDTNAWSHWWGSVKEDSRGQSLFDAINEMGLHILNEGNIPTFETVRGGKHFKSHVDVTTCSDELLHCIDEWKVDRNVTSSDHNAIIIKIKLDKHLPGVNLKTTRKFDTKKANWIEFKTELIKTLNENNITVEKIQEISSKTDLEAVVNIYINSVNIASERKIPLKKQNTKTKLPWWSEELENLKRDMTTKKRRISCAAPRRKAFVIGKYVEAKEKYETEALKAQTTSWKIFCSQQDRESVWDGIYRVIGRTSKSHGDQPLMQNGSVLSPEESVKLLATTFFPDDVVTEDQEEHKILRQKAENMTVSQPGDQTQDPPFTMSELKHTINSFNPKKAPGPDGFTPDICAAAIEATAEHFLALANKCLELSCFPSPWKEAAVVVLRKPGREDYSKPKSYRPIGLLPVFGKILEKLMVKRLRWHILPKSNPKQYGFTPQRCTEDALYDLTKYVKENLRKKQINLIVSLDIEGAFDSAWWPAIKCRLLEYKLPLNLRSLVNDYFENRKVSVGYLGQQHKKRTTKGCVQGSIGGPTFWNVLLDPLLDEMEERGVFCQAFADDIVLVFSGTTALEIEKVANPTLAHVKAWGAKNRLIFAAHKTNALLVTKKLKYDTPRIHMDGTNIQMVEEVKILGLTIDSKLTYETHVTNICRKATKLYNQLSRAAKISWGLNPEVVTTIYVAVVEPIILYASGVWGEASNKISIQKHLNVVQRGFAQKICKAYRTVSLNAALTMSGLLPLDMRVRECAQLYRAKRGEHLSLLGDGEVEKRTSYLKAPHPAREPDVCFGMLEDTEPHTLEKHQIEGPQIFTDGSKIEGKVGAALTLWRDGVEIDSKKFKLAPCCTVFQAEMFALYKATSLALKIENNIVNILSDSRSSLELLQNRDSHNPLGFQIRQNILKINEEGKKVRLFWIRAHVGVAGNERADELAKHAALNMKTAPDYDCRPISFVKRTLRLETLQEWNERYVNGETAETTKIFFPNVVVAYKLIKKITLTPVLVQVLTGHGGFGQYLHRFKCKDNPSCVCDSDKEESIMHLLLECPKNLKIKFETEEKLGLQISKDTMWELLGSKKRKIFINYCEQVAKDAIERNKT